MKVSLKKIERVLEEHAIICCYEVNDDIKSIVKYIKSTGTLISGYDEDRQKQVVLNDIYYIEAVDNKVFAYTSNNVYELKCKLYEFAEQYDKRHFFRCSKSCIVNLMKIESVQPFLNGRLSAVMLNKEELIISRQYVPLLKKTLLGEEI